MRYDITEPEQKFAAISAGMNSLVMGCFEQYESEKQTLIETLKQVNQENQDLKAKLDLHKIVTESLEEEN